MSISKNKIGSDGYIRKTIRLSPEKWKGVEREIGGNNFNRWVNLLIENELKGVKGNGGNVEDKGKNLDKHRDKMKGEKLDRLLDDNLISILQENGEEVLSSLSNLELAKLAVQRAPKALNLDYDHEAKKLSLRSALKRLPDAEEFRKELIRVKGELRRLEVELDMRDAMLKRLERVYKGLGVEGEGVYRDIVELCREVSQKSYELRGEDELRDMVSKGLELIRLTNKPRKKVEVKL